MSDLSKITRRKFLSTGTCGTMGFGSLINTVAQLQLINSAAASTTSVGADYKALVCLFLRGGCDMNNVLIPIGANPQKANYSADRGVVALNETAINTAGTEINYPDATDQQFGLHPKMPNLAAMFNSNDAAFVTNVGTLAQPTTAATYDSVGLPRQLFSHSDQVTEWMSSISDQPYRSGWGARVAELYHSTWNPETQTSMLITAAGNNQLFNGGAQAPYSVTSAGAISLAGFGNNYSEALTGNNYQNTVSGQRLKALERMMSYSNAHLLEEGYAAVVRRARENEDVINEAAAVADALSLNIDGIFNTFGAGNNNLADELKAISKLIAGRKCLGNTRQIFFVDLGGFDNHQDINSDLSKLLETVDKAVGAFNETMKQLEIQEAQLGDGSFKYDQVTTFQASDFNRTWTPNSDDTRTAGTDHAWGSHCFVFGGAVNGGQFYGTFPELAVGGTDDVPSGSRGRWIPTTSVDQYCAKLANWFDVPAGSSEMETIFPNLNRFEDPFDINGSSNLGFI